MHFGLLLCFLIGDSGVWVCCGLAIAVVCSLVGIYLVIDCGIVLNFGFAGLL